MSASLIHVCSSDYNIVTLNTHIMITVLSTNASFAWVHDDTRYIIFSVFFSSENVIIRVHLREYTEASGFRAIKTVCCRIYYYNNIILL